MANEWLLTDEEIEEIDIGCGLSEINGSQPYYRLKYEHTLLKAQAKKLVKRLEEEGEYIEGDDFNLLRYDWEVLRKEVGIE